MQIDWLKTCRLHVYYKRRMCKEKTIKRAGKICRGIFIINSYRLKRGGKRIGCDIHTALLRTHAHFCFYFKGGYIYIYIFPSFCLFFQAGCRSLKNGRDTRKALLTLDCVDFLIPYAQAALKKFMGKSEIHDMKENGCKRTSFPNDGNIWKQKEKWEEEMIALLTIWDGIKLFTKWIPPFSFFNFFLPLTNYI